MILTYRLGWGLTRLIASTVFRMRRYGHRNIPETGPFIIASNHKSLADPPLVGSFIWRQVHFMAKRELFKNPVFGAIIRSTNAHPIRRGAIDKGAIETINNLLNGGQGVVIFPEGTRARGVDFLDPKPGIGLIARQALVPVVPAYIHGSDKMSEVFRGKEKMAVIYGEMLDKKEISRYDDSKLGYRELAEEIMRRIKGLKEDFLRRSRISPHKV